MQWMIDGAYGEHYRRTMGYPVLKPHNEQEPVRKGSARPIGRRFLTRFVSALHVIVGFVPSRPQVLGGASLPSGPVITQKETLTSSPLPPPEGEPMASLRR